MEQITAILELYRLHHEYKLQLESDSDFIFNLNELELKLRERYPDHGRIEVIEDSLIIAVKHDDLEITKEIIDNYPGKFKNASGDIKSRAGDDISFLHLAVENKSIEMLKLLLPVGMNLSFRDINGDTAISKAIKNNDDKALKLFREYNKDPNNELNPYYDMIQYVTKATGIDSRGSTMASRDGKDISFFNILNDKSIAELMLKSRKIDTIIYRLNNNLNINIDKKMNVRKSKNISSFYELRITLLLSFDDAKKIDKQVSKLILGVVEDFTNEIIKSNRECVSICIAKYLNITDTEKLIQVCSRVNKSFIARVTEAKNENSQQLR